MDWLNNVGFSAAGLPWWAALLLMILTLLLTKGIDAALKWQKARLEERQYGDGEARMAREQLVKELKDRVEKLEAQSAALSNKLSEAHLAHAKCEVEQAKLQGKLDSQVERMNAMQIQIDRLTSHDENNAANKKVLKEAVAQIDPQAAAKLN